MKSGFKTRIDKTFLTRPYNIYYRIYLILFVIYISYLYDKSLQKMSTKFRFFVHSYRRIYTLNPEWTLLPMHKSFFFSFWTFIKMQINREGFYMFVYTHGNEQENNVSSWMTSLRQTPPPCDKIRKTFNCKRSKMNS